MTLDPQASRESPWARGTSRNSNMSPWTRIPRSRSPRSATGREKGRGGTQVGDFPRLRRLERDARRAERPDFVDMVTPPETHEELCRDAAEFGAHVVCQKPLAPTLEASRRLVEMRSKSAGVRFMVHENFRFQPWYRKIKEIEPAGPSASSLISISDAPGDGWGHRAYLGRQPSSGPSATAGLRDGRPFHRHVPLPGGRGHERLCSGAALECASRARTRVTLLAVLDGATAMWDANRYNEVEAQFPRYTFGNLRLDATAGI